MPRPPKVPHEQLKEVILSTSGVIDNEGCIPGPTQNVWTIINKNVGGVLKPEYIYQYVRENRHSVLNELRKKYELQSDVTPYLKLEDDTESDASVDEIISTNGDSPDSTILNPIKPKATFEILIPESKWIKIRPIEKLYSDKRTSKKKKYTVLPSLQWTPIITELLWDQHKLPCPYTFRRAKVYTDQSYKHQYVSISAKCKECGAEAEGKILDKPPPGCDVKMIWRANDTRTSPHDTKRHLFGDKRKFVGGVHLKNTSSSMFRKQSARVLMDQGDVEPPHLYKTDVLRKAKQEQRDSALEVAQGAHPLLCLATMKHTQPYAGFIHEIWLDKVGVQYSSPAQMLMYKNYNKKQHIVLSLDATGGLVEKIQRTNDLSGHIFLYELVMHTGLHQLPVHQMLSEKHDANTILYWLNEWERRGAPCPKEVSMDNSPALKSATARGFGRSRDLHEYIDRCFEYLIGTDSVQLPPCFIRLDVAHYLNAAKKLNMWKDKERARLRDFYLRCLGLLIKCTAISDFTVILKNTLIMALHPSEGEGVSIQNMNVKSSLKYLSERIKGVEIDYQLSNSNGKNSISENELPEAEDNSHEFSCDRKINGERKITSWLKNIVHEVTDVIPVKPTGRLNPYYCPSFADELCRMTKEFTLWSGVLVEGFESPNVTATSAPVESDFCDLKRRILEGTMKASRIDRFVAIHLQAIEGSCRITGAPKVLDSTATNKHDLRKKHFYSKKTELINVGEDTLYVTSSVTKKEPAECPSAESTITEQEEFVDDPASTVYKNEGFRATFDEVQSLTEAPIHTDDDHSYSAPYDLKSFENWRGLAKRDVPRESKYMTPLPQFEAAVKANRLKQPSKRLLINGNYIKFIEIPGGITVIVKNTCPFDALCQVLTEAYINYPSCRHLMDSSDNGILKTARILALDGALKSTYVLRAEVLSKILQPSGILKLTTPTSSNINLNLLLAKEYNCWSNAYMLANKLLNEENLIEIIRDCPNANCSIPKTVFKTTADTNSNVILQNGISELGRSVAVGLRMCNSDDNDDSFKLSNSVSLESCNPTCPSSATITFKFGQFLIIDIDFMSHPHAKDLLLQTNGNLGPYSLHDIPTQLQICNNTFKIVGVVAHRPNHYVAYTKKSHKTWEVFDDLTKQVQLCDEQEKVSAHLIIYIKEN